MIFVCANCESTSAGTAVRRSTATKAPCTYCVSSLQRTGREWCRRGKHAVMLADIVPHKERVWCRTCKAASDRAQYATHGRPGRVQPPRTPEQRERQRMTNRRYAERNREQIRARQRRHYWSKSRQRRIAAARERRQSDPAAFYARQRVYKARRLIRILRGASR